MKTVGTITEILDLFYNRIDDISIHTKHTVENARDKEFVCECCGKHFTGKPFGQHKFCTNACKTRLRQL